MRCLTVYPEKCTGCHRCELWCSMHHEKVMNPGNGRLRVIRREPYMDVPAVCLQCGLCINGCSFGAISRNKKTGAVEIDGEKCKNCGMCLVTCPYGMIVKTSEAKKVTKCDLCGGDPECVKHCKEGAVCFEDYEAVAKARREVYAKGLNSPAIKPGAASNVHI